MRGGAALRAGVVLALLGLVFVSRAPAQQLRAELRSDGIFATQAAWLAGAGVSTPLARSVTLAAAGMGAVARQTVAERGRLEVLGRFLLDPERQSSASVYIGGGAAAVIRDDHRWTGVLTVMVGVELGRARRWVPFVETGVGGGVRVAGGVRKR